MAAISGNLLFYCTVQLQACIPAFTGPASHQKGRRCSNQLDSHLTSDFNAKLELLGWFCSIQSRELGILRTKKELLYSYLYKLEAVTIFAEALEVFSLQQLRIFRNTENPTYQNIHLRDNLADITDSCDNRNNSASGN